MSAQHHHQQQQHQRQQQPQTRITLSVQSSLERLFPDLAHHSNSQSNNDTHSSTTCLTEDDISRRALAASGLNVSAPEFVPSFSPSPQKSRATASTGANANTGTISLKDNTTPSPSPSPSSTTILHSTTPNKSKSLQFLMPQTTIPPQDEHPLSPPDAYSISSSFQVPNPDVYSNVTEHLTPSSSLSPSSPHSYISPLDRLAHSLSSVLPLSSTQAHHAASTDSVSSPINKNGGTKSILPQRQFDIHFPALASTSPATSLNSSMNTSALRKTKTLLLQSNNNNNDDGGGGGIHMGSESIRKSSSATQMPSLTPSSKEAVWLSPCEDIDDYDDDDDNLDESHIEKGRQQREIKRTIENDDINHYNQNNKNNERFIQNNNFHVDSSSSSSRHSSSKRFRHSNQSQPSPQAKSSAHRFNSGHHHNSTNGAVSRRGASIHNSNLHTSVGTNTSNNHHYLYHNNHFQQQQQRSATSPTVGNGNDHDEYDWEGDNNQFATSSFRRGRRADGARGGRGGSGGGRGGRNNGRNWGWNRERDGNNTDHNNLAASYETIQLRGRQQFEQQERETTSKKQTGWSSSSSSSTTRDLDGLIDGCNGGIVSRRSNHRVRGGGTNSIASSHSHASGLRAGSKRT